jgi:hypothetical protein
MLDEFDDVTWPVGRPQGASESASASDTVPRLITRMYAASDERLRAGLLSYLLRPLGSLGLAAVAAGAFATFLQRRTADGFTVTIEDVTRYTGDQISELVGFVGQVSPESLQAVVGTLADNPLGATAFTASALMLLMRALRPTTQSTGTGGSAIRPAPGNSTSERDR